MMSRNFGLDLIRVFSISLVLLQHADINIPGLSPLKIGGIGVEIFFVLSGFLIGGIILNDLKKNNSFIYTISHFWFKRWFRILPLYYIILGFKYLFIDQTIGHNIFYYFLFLQNNFYGISYLDVSWSLVIEEWFYLISPIFLYISFKILKSKKTLIFSAIIFFILLINVLRFFYVKIGQPPYQGVNSNPLFRFDSLFLGILLAFIKDNYPLLFKFISKKTIFTFGVLILILYLFIFWKHAYPINNINSSLWIKTLGFLILPFSISLAIPFISTIKIDINKSLLNKVTALIITRISILTYAIYLIHPFIYSVFLHIDKYPFLFTFIISICMTIVSAILLYNFIEKPFLKLRDKLL